MSKIIAKGGEGIHPIVPKGNEWANFFSEIGKDVFFQAKGFKGLRTRSRQARKKWGVGTNSSEKKRKNRKGGIYFKGSFSLVVKLSGWRGGGQGFVSFDS